MRQRVAAEAEAEAAAAICPCTEQHSGPSARSEWGGKSEWSAAWWVRTVSLWLRLCGSEADATVSSARCPRSRACAPLCA